MKIKNAQVFVILLSTVWLSNVWLNPSFASTSGHPLSDIKFSQDREALQRGANIYYKVCRVCHSMKYIRYKHLLDLGISKSRIDNMRGDNPLNQTLSKTITDNVLVEYYGQVPPDLSVMAKARKHGPQYIYTLLTSYEEKEGKYDNLVLPGTKMPDIMNISTSIDEAQKTKINSEIKDVTEFLLWASDPRAAERKTTGMYVIGYFVLLSIMLYLVMKRVWSRLD